MANKTKNKIMRRVYAIWFARTVAPLVAVEAVVFVVALNVFASNVFVERAVGNALLHSLGDPIDLAAYFMVAFAKTQALTKIMLILFAVIGVAFTRDLGRSIASYMLVRRSHAAAGNASA